MRSKIHLPPKGEGFHVNPSESKVDKPGDRNRSGPEINWTIMFDEAWGFASAMRNEADAMQETITQAVLDRRYIGQATVNGGIANTQAALLAPDNSPACFELVLAIAGVTRSETQREFGPEYRWWKAVIQTPKDGGPPFRRHKQPGDQEYADTEFTTYPGS
jgi:hypothetical protein